ncbi:hypothetical protein ACFRKB_34990 [Streptomyces scopuliridis]|uniref:hypothetical protein n=1 Tax=Streptomyces scopuliridis TaxID=452529 RepID=UPI0036969C6D
MSSYQRLRRLRRTVVLASALSLTTACGGMLTQSPPEHASRLDKAAGVARFEITCTRDMWDETRDSMRGDSGSTTFDEVKPRKLGGEQGARGLVTVTLTGPQLVEYLRKLDYEAHPGHMTNASDDDGPLARRMYNALAPVVDRIKPGQMPAEIPQAVVDDAAVSAGSQPSSGPSAKS